LSALNWSSIDPRLARKNFLKNTRKVVLLPIVRMLFSGYICNRQLDMSGDASHFSHKEATNQSLNQKSRCFYIGAFAFIYFDVLKVARGVRFGSLPDAGGRLKYQCCNFYKHR